MLTRNGWSVAALAVVSLVLGASLGYVELVALGVAFALCLLLSGVWLALRPQLDVHRELSPTKVNEGDGAAGVLTVTNVGRRRCPPILAVEAFDGGSVTVPLAGLAPRTSHVASYRLPTDRRGCYAVGPLQMGHADPFGLVSFSQAYGAEATLWVYPRVHRVSPVPTGRSQDIEGPTSAGAPRGGIAFHSLREYEPGDDPRLIHWRSTARTGKMMVRHTVITNEPRILVVLDTSLAPYADDSFEDAVRVAASLVSVAAERRYPTDFRTTGGVSGTIDPTGHGRSDVFDKLAAVQPSTSDPGLAALTGLAARRVQGVAAGVVTGQPSREQANAVALVRGRFEMVTMVQVGERFDRPPIHVPGVLGVNAATSEDFVRIWKTRIG